MKLKQVLLGSTLAIPLAAVAYAQSSEPEGLTPYQLYEYAQDRTVTVFIHDYDNSGNPDGYGTGFFVSPTLIMTAYHVVEEVQNDTVTIVSEHAQSTEGSVVCSNEEKDIALIEVQPNEDLSFYIFGSDPVSHRSLYIYGHPIHSENDILTHATFAGFYRDLVILHSFTAPGGSGSPVMDTTGHVVGMSIIVANQRNGEGRVPTPLVGMVPVDDLADAYQACVSLPQDRWVFPVDPFGRLM